MDLGIVVGGDLSSLGSLAADAERAGFESVWVAETARSAFVQAALVACATDRVTVGTDIALAFPRSPTITAMSARDLAELSGGRFVLGLGTQVKRVNEGRFSVPFEHPAPRIAEAVEAIRAVLGTFRGLPIDHRGRFYTLAETARFDDHGLWAHEAVWFSRYGTLLATVETFVNRSSQGFFASDLANALHVEVQDALYQLIQQGRLQRIALAGHIGGACLGGEPVQRERLADLVRGR